MGIEVQVILLRNDILYIALEQGGQIWIVRDGKPNLILENARLISGQVKMGDILFIADRQLTQVFSKRTIKTALQKGNAAGIRSFFQRKLIHKHITTTRSILAPFTQSQSTQVSKQLIKPLNNILKMQTGLKMFLRSGLQFLSPKRVVIGLGILCMFIGIYYAWNLYEAGFNRRKKIEVQLTGINHKYEEGTTLIELNPLRARKLLNEARNELNQLLQTERDLQSRKLLETKLRQIDETLIVARRRFDVSLDPFFNLTLIKSNSQGDKMTLFGDLMVILDKINGKLYDLLLTTKASRIISGTDILKTALDISVHGEDVYVLFAHNFSKLQFPQGDLTPVITDETTWKTVIGFNAYAGNMYVLDKGSNQIWKYRLDDTSVNKQSYFLFDTQTDLQGVNFMRIDGSIWLVYGGGLKRFIQGTEVEWQVQGLDTNLGSQIDLYTADATQHLYILDKSHNRVVILDKEGLYLAQYAWKEDVQISSFVVSESLKKILLLSRDTIYGIDLK